MQSSRRLFMLGGASAMSLALAGCFGGRPPLTFDLGAAESARVSRRSSRSVVITLPKAVQTYDSQRVVVREAGNLLSYLPESQLSDTLPSLIQTRLLQTFESGGFPNVGRPDDQLRVDVTLATEVRAFEIDVSRGNLATVTLNAKLVDERAGTIFANQTFTASAQAATNPVSAAISGLDAALQDVMKQILVWTARHA